MGLEWFRHCKHARRCTERPHSWHEQPCVCTSEGSGCKHFKFHVWLLQILKKKHHRFTFPPMDHRSHQHPEDTRPVGHRRADDFGRHVGSADYGGTFSKARFHGLSLGKNTHVTRIHTYSHVTDSIDSIPVAMWIADMVLWGGEVWFKLQKMDTESRTR